MITHIINKHIPANFFLPLANKIIAIELLDFSGRTFYCCFEDQLYIVDGISQPVDVTISSSLAGFVKYALFQDHSEVNINGNIFVAQTLQQLLGKLDIDWEEELSKYAGDVIAHQSIRIIKEFKNHNLQEMITEYLQEESLILPTNGEVQEFLQDVDILRNDVDRLAARIQMYEKIC